MKLLRVTNIKSSIKLKPAVELDFVAEKCFEIGAYCKRHGNLLSIKHKNISFVLFKACYKPNHRGQHLNITSVKDFKSVIDAIVTFLHLVKNITKVSYFRIDNISCTSRISKKLDLEKIYLSNKNHRIVFNPESFPGLFFWSWSKKSLCAVLYHTCLLYKSKIPRDLSTSSKPAAA